MEEQLQKDILSSIDYSGSSESMVKPIVASFAHLNRILDKSNGTARILKSVQKNFSLILSQPNNLSSLSSFEIRCCLCSSVIKYPCWYWRIQYSINHFHYFVCFNEEDKITTKCMRKG